MLDVSPNLLKAVFDPSIAPPVIGQGVNPFDHVPYLPQPGKPQEFFDCKASIIIYGGSSGSSKSSTLLLKALKGSASPEYTATIFRKTLKDVMAPGGLWARAQQLYKNIPGAKQRESVSYLDWRFPDGGIINFSHADKLERGKQGSEMAFIAIDEIATDWSQDDFLFLISRNRSSSGVPPQLIGTCNPDSESFLIRNPETEEWKKGSWLEWWIDDDGFPIQERSGVIRYFTRVNNALIWGDSKEEILEKCPELEKYTTGDVSLDDLVKSFTFISANIYDNPAFLKSNPEYLGNLLMQDEDNQKRLLHGNWKTSKKVGIIFNPEWFPVIDVVPPGYDYAFWDFAATAKEVATNQSYYSARAKWRYCPLTNGEWMIVILDVVWVQEDPEDSDNTVIDIAIEDTRDTMLGWELEGGSAGLRYANTLSKALKRAVPGIRLSPQKPLGDKVTRAKGWATKAKPVQHPVTGEFKNRIFLRRGGWNQKFWQIVTEFDGSKKPLINDVIDACSGCNVLVDQYHNRGRRRPQSGEKKVESIRGQF